jgi:hypothetical protein
MANLIPIITGAIVFIAVIGIGVIIYNSDGPGYERCQICDGFAALASAKAAIANTHDYKTFGNNSEISFTVNGWPDERHVSFTLTYPRTDGKIEQVNTTCYAYYGGNAGPLEEKVLT